MKDLEHKDFADGHCSRWGGIDQTKITPFGRRSCQILVEGLGEAIYNLPVKWENADWNYGDGGVRLCVRCYGWATFDFDELTGLVLAAHEMCVRVQIKPIAPRYMEVVLFQRRGREGHMFERHPSFEDMVRACGVKPTPSNSRKAVGQEQ